ncbi:MAG: peptidylprolyl isomerase [Proteobacteria bacterium]|nr:peptidylprolyl isomerase [Pseudomonadota bacterium]
MLFAIFFPAVSTAENPTVIIKTSKGDIGVVLYADESPITVANFLSYVDAGAYDKNIFHRVIAGFMIQTGGYFEDLSSADVGESLYNEADNGLNNVRGTLAMARMNAIDSADRQFFINLVDNVFLDHSEASCSRQDEKALSEAHSRGLFKPQTCKSFGYAVFGEVISGMEVVDAIEIVDTGSRKSFTDLPLETVFIESIMRFETQASE